MKKENFSCMRCGSENTVSPYLKEEDKVLIKCLDCGFELKYFIENNIITLDYNSEDLNLE